MFTICVWLGRTEQARALRAATHQEGKTMHIGFIGLGQMGAGMAANLVKAAHDVTVYNRTRAKAEALVAQGAKAAAGVSDACRGDAVITMLANDDAVGRVVFGDGGIIASLQAGAIHISSSTISVALSEALASAHAKAYFLANLRGLPVSCPKRFAAETVLRAISATAVMKISPAPFRG